MTTPALEGAAGALVMLSANPIHDTGGGQRSAQLALEFLARKYAVLFVSHGQVTETVDLRLSFAHPRLAQMSLADVGSSAGATTARAFLQHRSAIVVTQIAVKPWLQVLALARHTGAVSVYDLVDEWDSELGYGWYGRRIEGRVAAWSDLLVATAPGLQRYLWKRTGRAVALIPNAFNDRLFSGAAEYERPADLPKGPVAIYVGSLWGGWMDWALIHAMARALPGVSFVFVGDHRGEGRDLPANCHFLGLKPQSALAPYLQHSAVGLLPWKNDRVTQATSPLKVYEYVAMGLRVAAPQLEPLKAIPGVTLCADPDQFVQAIRSFVGSKPTPGERQQMDAFTQGQSWPRRVDALLALASASRKSPDRPGALARMRAWMGL